MSISRNKIIRFAMNSHVDSITRKISSSKNVGTIVVATLNYCDIMNNPFEFYCEEYEQELAEISNIFVELIPKYTKDFNPNKYKWQMGKVDQKIRIGRYSPAFALYAGIKNDGFMSRAEFQAKWDHDFNNIPAAKQTPFSEEERVNTRLYDLMLFHALLTYAYGQESFEELIQNPPDKYMDLYRPFYDLSFLSEEKKIEKFMESFSMVGADVFFLQQYSDQLKDKIQASNKYHVAVDGVKDKLIIAKKATFPVKKKVEDTFSEQELKDLAWSEPPAILVADKYIIINVHLSSKTEKNKVQVEHMKKSLLAVQKKHVKYNLIVGGDINSFFGKDGSFEQIFDFFPREEHQLTTVKKRTMTQGQFHKGNKIVAESKDKIISNLKIQQGSVRYITNQEMKEKSLIPTDKHPFDHFVVVAFLDRP